MILKPLLGLKQLLPYNASNFTGDITAGVIVTFLLLPQSMAYAIIAGVPLTMGLLSGTFPLIIYALFGSSKYLSVGPVSIVSLLAFTAVSSVAKPDSERFLEIMVILSLLVGIVQLILGLLKVGSLLKYVSPAVIGGFTSALAIIIIFNQMDSIIGATTSSYQNFLAYSLEIMTTIPKAHVLTVMIGLISLLFLLVLKKIFRVSPGPLIIIITSILVVDYFDLDKKGVEIVGGISRESPNVALSLPAMETIYALVPIALIIGFISFFESFSVAKNLADKENEDLNSNQELVSLGFANMTSSLVGSIPVAGAISRTAVNYESGAKTKFSLFITAFLMLLAIFYVTPLFYYLPKATLAAIIIIAVVNLINVKQLRHYQKNEPLQAFIFLATFTATLIMGVFVGLVVGIGLTIVLNFRS
ncbi:SulP family inorganic anion transporter [Lentibacillus sp. CBA3610]|uniref:SulP family inorganic anion transporter n=1 Tax=Lentibacillus sp. CBA3610 TaxID=2518176 RepID=UPI0015958B8E|nr:SulP family inorganic anion transporter [Lentibacillus sp. CBA3610]QKY70122.1 sodium-independent anion transporter [Lentibacillus sp. CBA3610]